VSGNPHQEIDRFHGRTLQAIYPRKTVISTTCHIRTVDAYHWAWKAFSPALVGRNCIAKSDILQRIEELRAQGLSAVSINTYLRSVNAFCHWMFKYALDAIMASTP